MSLTKLTRVRDNQVTLPRGTVANAVMFVTPEQFNAPCDGVSDDAPYVSSALAYAAQRRIPLVMNGEYLHKTPVTYQGVHVEVTGTGKIVFEGGAFDLKGSVGAEVALTTDISVFSATSIDIASASGFSEGDLGIIHSSVMCLSADAGSMQLGEATASGSPSWFGEFFQVNGTTGNTLSLSSPLVYNLYPTTARPNSGIRTASTVKKVTPITGGIYGSISFERAGTGTAVSVEYGRGFSVSGNFDSKKLPGASVIFLNSLDCETTNSRYTLDPSTKVTFGTANPGNPNYFQFNAVKCVSSQGCGASNCSFENQTQTFDITYKDMPSTICYIRGCTVLFARHNMATSHGGSFGSVFSNNTGVNCWRGIAARSREDVVSGNRIVGFRKYPTNPNTNGDTYGISLTEGFTVGATIMNNYVSGFYRNIFINNSSSRGIGFDYNRITISGNRLSYCRHHVEIDNAVPTDKSIDSGIVITNNQFDGHEREALLIGQYTRTPIIKGNIFLDSPSGDYYQVKTEGNCVGLELTDNSFKDGAKTLWVQAITDPAVGQDSIAGAAVTSIGNTTRGNSASDSFVYGNSRVSLGNNFQEALLGYKYVSVTTATDYTLLSDTLTVATLAPQAGAFNLVGISGGINGRELTLFCGSENNPITIKNSSTVQTLTNADVIMRLSTPVRFVFVSGKWRQI